MTTPSAPPAPARALGIAGLLPFLAGVAGIALAPAAAQPRLAFALVAYGATIVAFLGGLHWGLAAQRDARPAQFAWGVVPPLLAWIALLLPAYVGLAVLAVALLACLAVDWRVLPAQRLLPWLRLRAGLTAVAATSCAVAAFALN